MVADLYPRASRRSAAPQSTTPAPDGTGGDLVCALKVKRGEPLSRRERGRGEGSAPRPVKRRTNRGCGEVTAKASNGRPLSLPSPYRRGFCRGAPRLPTRGRGFPAPLRQGSRSTHRSAAHNPLAPGPHRREPAATTLFDGRPTLSGRSDRRPTGVGAPHPVPAGLMPRRSPQADRLRPSRPDPKEDNHARTSANRRTGERR